MTSPSKPVYQAEYGAGIWGDYESVGFRRLLRSIGLNVSTNAQEQR